jgi:sensor histidine kinase regulating citrate/malate metabolism
MFSHETVFTRDLISISRAHYEKMNKMYMKIRIMRHDYKYHLNTVGKLLTLGDIEGIKQYLNGLEILVSETEPHFYCSNSIINALLSHYSECCVRSNINFTVKIALPQKLLISDYELCIVFGNLLENAFDACLSKEEKRNIELSVDTQGSQIGIMVRNSFNGILTAQNKKPLSLKKNGGIGLQSVEALVALYEGHTFFEWDEDKFTAYVMLQNIERK